MSAGAFSDTFYEAADGSVWRVKVQPETLALNVNAANAAPAGTGNIGVYARVSGSRRGTGLKCRGVRIRFTGAVPDGYSAGGSTYVPILTPTVYSGIKPGDTGTYLGSPVRVLSKSSEFPDLG